MSSEKKRILLVYHSFSAFVRNDYNLLSKHFVVDKYAYQISRKVLPFALAFVRQFFFLLIRGRKYDLYYCWFADYHSFLPSLFSRFFNQKSVIILAGYDVARLPEYGYGVFTSKLRGYAALSSMKNASLLLPASQHLERKIRAIAPESKLKLMHNAVSLKIQEKEIQEKEKLIITIAKVSEPQTYYIKGIDTFLKTATYLKDYQFAVIGIQAEKIQHLFPEDLSNVKLIGSVLHEELKNYFKKAVIYCQFSRSEGFSITLAESMLFKCIPFVTDIGGMPEVIGPYGIIVPRNPEAIASQIKSTVSKDTRILKKNARARVVQNFMIESREKRLLDILTDLLQ